MMEAALVSRKVSENLWVRCLVPCQAASVPCPAPSSTHHRRDLPPRSDSCRPSYRQKSKRRHWRRNAQPRREMEVKRHSLSKPEKLSGSKQVMRPPDDLVPTASTAAMVKEATDQVTASLADNLGRLGHHEATAATAVMAKMAMAKMAMAKVATA